MNDISHQQAMRLIEQGQAITSSDREMLELHLMKCGNCQQYADQKREFDTALRNAMHNHIPTVAYPAKVISNRIKERIMAKHILNFSGTAAVIVFFVILVLFSNQTLPNRGSQSASLKGETFTRETLTTLPVTIENVPVDFHWPMLFESEKEGNSEVYLTTNGKDLVNLSRNPANDTEAVWSPDGKWIAFISDRAKKPDGNIGKQELFVMDANGNSVTQITNEPNLKWSGPLDWSSDGKWISIIGSPIFGMSQSNLYVAKLDGSGAELIGPPYTISSPSHPRWSPIEPVIAFSSKSGSGSHLYIYDMRTGKARDAAPEDAPNDRGMINIWPNDSFEWLSDGRLVYSLNGPYQSFQQNGESHVEPVVNTRIILKTRPTEARNKIDMPIPLNIKGNSGWDMSISPDGRIAALPGIEKLGCSQIQILSTDNPGKITSINGLCSVVNESGEPHWLFGNRWLVLSAWVNNNDQASALYLIDVQAALESDQVKYFRLIDTITWDRNPQPAPENVSNVDLHIDPQPVQSVPLSVTIQGVNTCQSISTSQPDLPERTFEWPSKNHIITNDNYRVPYPGIYLKGDLDDPVYASNSGVVMFEGPTDRGTGYTIILRHQLEYQTIYANLQTVTVKCGQDIKQGEIIGHIGKAESASAPELYFEVQMSGYALNPRTILPPDTTGE